MLEVKNISKDFGAVKALDNVSFSLERGRILGLVGDNGAGKSTLLKILSGDLQPTSGDIVLDGIKTRFKSTGEAMKMGVAIAYQFLELVDSAMVWENFFMGRELTRRLGPLMLLDIERMRSLAAQAIAKYGPVLDVGREVGELTGEQRQIVAVTRAIEADPKVLLLDESFTLLSMDGRREIVAFLKEVNKMKEITMVIVSHDLDLVKELSNYLMVLRGGNRMFFGRADEISVDEIVKYMLP
jgi:simple sugar transport system ATP-binding protein